MKTMCLLILFFCFNSNFAFTMEKRDQLDSEDQQEKLNYLISTNQRLTKAIIKLENQMETSCFTFPEDKPFNYKIIKENRNSLQLEIVSNCENSKKKLKGEIKVLATTSGLNQRTKLKIKSLSSRVFKTTDL